MSRVQRANAHTLTRSAAASSDSRDAVAAPEDPRATARTGDLGQTVPRSLPTSCPRARAGPQMPTYHANLLQAHHFPAPTS